ncbi:MYND finger [Colletotrichum graminicola M1.001]|uniref:MYND finger n=1 Tax=Colletotrichum graminicola (strain M1.001 / M2 / FGSC 10212) TaxID=645133 RepID=E3QYV4_COLGM|nr:MYND finger [Colletotrichum graminicola M1.001]EFQ36042.1 MYND finger [Colletotrichum graminicola M1.001]
MDAASDANEATAAILTQGEDVPEALSSFVPTSTTQADDGFINILDLAVNQTKTHHTRSDLFSFTIHAVNACLYPLTHFISFVILVFNFPWTLTLKRESAVDRVLREADMAHQGLYDSPKRSFFPSTGREHLLRLVNVSGSTQTPVPKKLTENDKKCLRQLDYILWQDELPPHFDRARRYDCMPGDPVDRLFAALPSVADDDGGFKEPDAAAQHDRRFVLALWPYANSSLEDILDNTKDPNAHNYWWAARFAFSVWERSDLSIRCAFTQLLGQLAAAHIVPIDKDCIEVVPGHKCSVSNESEPCPGEAYVKRNDWLKYVRWIHRGRRDADAVLETRKILARASEMKEALRSNKCARCDVERGGPGAPPKNSMFYCSGCYVSWYPGIRRVYCSKECQKEDWANHFPDCQRRKHFLRAVYLFKGVAAKFMAATYSGFAVDCVGVELRGAEKKEKFDRSGVPRTAVSLGAYGAGHWTGQQVFPLGQSFLSHRPTADVRKVLAWDAGNNLYYHLQPIIEKILGPHCDTIVEMEFFIRNATSISALASDTCREGLQIQIAKGKDPMFWPHPVLTCRLKGSSSRPGDVFVIDLLSEKFGFADVVLPFTAFIESRYVSCASSTIIQNMEPHWYPPYQKGLVTCRDTVSSAWADCINKYFANFCPNLKGPWQVACLKEDKWSEKARGIMAVSDIIFKDITDCIRQQDIYRQYLVHDPNPYSHEFSIGVTSSQEECDLYKNIWMKRSTYDIIIKDDLVEQHKKLPPGSEARRLTALWTDRLSKHGKRASFDSVALLGRRVAKHYGICTDHTADEYRELEKAWLLYSGIPEADIDMFYDRCVEMFGDLTKMDPTTPGSMTPEMFQTMMRPEAALDGMKHMTAEEKKTFMAIGAYVNMPFDSDFMMRIQAQAAKVLRQKKM